MEVLLLFIGNNVIGTANVVNGVATYSYKCNLTGTISIKAVYSGFNHFNPSNTTFTLNVAKLNTTVVVNPINANYGKSVDLSATVKVGNVNIDGDIVTNPPYRYATEFIEKALSLVYSGNKVCMFLKVQFLEGKARRGEPRNTVFPVFGYQYNSSFERIPDPDTAPIVQFIFKKYIETGSTRKVANLLKENNIKLNNRLYNYITVYEEVGHGGAASIPEGVTEMISVDMGCVGDGLKCTERQVSICCKDSHGPYNYDVVTRLIEAARKTGADYAVDVYPHYGSDVDCTLDAGYDIRHGLIGSGVYASHGYERSHIEGVENTIKLLIGYCI